MSGSRRRRTAVAGLAAAALVLAVVPAADAVHFYRGPGSGCTPNDGVITDDASQTESTAATVLVLHNTFNDASTGLPVTRVPVGGTIQWDWASSHCHSVGVSGDPFYSGFHYPTAAPESPAVAPGLLHYPAPDLTPTLSYRHTFDTPGTYVYMCEHHAAIGMVGTVVVE